MRKINVKELFSRLCGLEYELIKYINRTQEDEPAPLNFYEIATALSAEKKDVMRACRRLVEAGVLFANGENFQINPAVFKVE